MGTWKGTEEFLRGGGSDLVDLVPTGKSDKIRIEVSILFSDWWVVDIRDFY